MPEPTEQCGEHDIMNRYTCTLPKGHADVHIEINATYSAAWGRKVPISEGKAVRDEPRA